MMGEHNELKNRYMVVAPPSEWVGGQTPTSTPTSAPTSTDGLLQVGNDNIVRLIKVIASSKLSVKEMMAAIGLKNRENFMEYSLNPAMREGFVSMLYPDKPRHPRQKYMLTDRGLAALRSGAD